MSLIFFYLSVFLPLFNNYFLILNLKFFYTSLFEPAGSAFGGRPTISHPLQRSPALRPTPAQGGMEGSTVHVGPRGDRGGGCLFMFRGRCDRWGRGWGALPRFFLEVPPSFSETPFPRPAWGPGSVDLRHGIRDRPNLLGLSIPTDRNPNRPGSVGIAPTEIGLRHEVPHPHALALFLNPLERHLFPRSVACGRAGTLLLGILILAFFWPPPLSPPCPRAPPPAPPPRGAFHSPPRPKHRCPSGVALRCVGMEASDSGISPRLTSKPSQN